MQNKPSKPFSTEAAVLKLTNYLLTMDKILPPGVSSQITINRGHIFFSLYQGKSIFAIDHALKIDASQNRVHERLSETYDLISRYIAIILEKNTTNDQHTHLS